MARTLAEARSQQDFKNDWERLVDLVVERVEQCDRQGLLVNRTAARLDRVEADMATVEQELATIREAVLSLAEQGARKED